MYAGTPVAAHGSAGSPFGSSVGHTSTRSEGQLELKGRKAGLPVVLPATPPRAEANLAIAHGQRVRLVIRSAAPVWALRTMALS